MDYIRLPYLSTFWLFTIILTYYNHSSRVEFTGNNSSLFYGNLPQGMDNRFNDYLHLRF